MRVNFWGVVHGVEAFVPRLLAQDQGGHIVNTASMAGLVGMQWLGVYCASKFAVVGLSEALNRELAPRGIGVSVLCPMIVADEHQRELAPQPARGAAQPRTTPTGRPGHRGPGAMVGSVIAVDEVGASRRARDRSRRPLRAHPSRAARDPAPARRQDRRDVRARSAGERGRQAPARVSRGAAGAAPSFLLDVALRKATSAAGIGLSASSSAVTTSRCAKPSAITTSNPPGAPPNVGNAGFGLKRSTTRGVPSQLGAVHTPMLTAERRVDARHRRQPVACRRTRSPGCRCSPPASGSRCRAGRGRSRARDESRLIDWEHCASAACTARRRCRPSRRPAVHTPADGGHARAGDRDSRRR